MRVFSNWDEMRVIMPREAMKERRERTRRECEKRREELRKATVQWECKEKGGKEGYN